ncbi:MULTISPECIES: glucosaminidase domain-containing protein [Fusobacterium]|uniref:glucosaminidase domain-containing protein n=1 Tax=Fusobacterium TaxID=848 RepID=UPI001F5026F8|nr:MULTISPECIES: glucosaminidase domain-containing protein [Fusobacterium]MDD7409927.1 glucosaminidase domain-containing protein [Fusobacteriaceae bacterium]MCI5725249.1 glucosaminidase domain-containing protein [Fusobacterium sp.]MCI7223923.1 glucosaminidase domain-containing protein [Fusobacterium sp.]MDY5305674.1 glucosaminidase domain-containing protein [Fusobacterium gastrosuis]MDY5712508.1 glucosaminidase domain-containing protein [Fusobacterium gastrosuis]
MKKYLLGIFLCMSLLSYSNILDQGKNTIIITQAKDLQKVKNKGKKQVFIETLIPVIDKIKSAINKEREYVESLLEKENLEEKEKEYLEEMYSKYNVKTSKIDDLLNKMIIPPTSFILAQASLESGWGRSKVAIEGNNLFGMRSTLKDPVRAVKVGAKDFYKKYESLEDSVEDYIMTLSRHKSYVHLRGGINSGKDSIELVKLLGNYSEVKNVYEQRLTQIIKKNDLQKHD